MSTPRILYIWQAGFPWEIRVAKVCRALVRAGCEVTVLARAVAGQPAEEDCDGIRVLRVGAGLPPLCSVPVPVNPLWYAKIHQVVKTWRPDLVLAREILLAEPAGRVCRRHGLPLVIDMAEHYPASMRAWKKYQRNALLRFLVFRAGVPDYVERRAVAWADGVITVCDEQNARLHASFGYPWERMAVVENTPESGSFAGVRKGVSEPPRVFAYHGHMTAQRGLTNLLRGFILAAQRDPEIRLLLAGGGESYEELVTLARQSGVADRIRFTGRYRFEELASLYGETDVGLVLQPPDESCDHTIPNKLYDYLACGKPVIVSPARPLRRVVEATGSGIALDSCDPEAIAAGIALMRTLDVRQMSANGLRACAERYHWGHDTDVLLRFLRSYLGREPAPATAMPKGALALA
jgi:glycosyltransferase involved in cell wall biosynthesis